MKTWEALKAVDEGKMCRRPCWPAGRYIHLASASSNPVLAAKYPETEAVFSKPWTAYVKGNPPRGVVFSLLGGSGDMNADDWEIF
jgi:hypothetical protein